MDCLEKIKHRKFKSDVLKTIKKWSLMFKQHLMDHVTNSLNDLEEFIREHDKGLSAPVKEGDIDALVVMMGHLMAVKDRQPTTDNMFEVSPAYCTLNIVYSKQLRQVNLCICKALSLHSIVKCVSFAS